MKYLICCDITDDKLRDDIAKYLEVFAFRLQYSVFVCDLSAARSDVVWKRLSEMAMQDEERGLVLMTPLCKTCVKGIFCCLKGVIDCGRVVSPVGRQFGAQGRFARDRRERLETRCAAPVPHARRHCDRATRSHHNSDDLRHARAENSRRLSRRLRQCRRAHSKHKSIGGARASAIRHVSRAERVARTVERDRRREDQQSIQPASAISQDEKDVGGRRSETQAVLGQGFRRKGD